VRKTFDEPVGYRVFQMKEDHGNAGGRGLDASHRLVLERDDQIDLISYELLRRDVSGHLVGDVPKV
jgi:hypothetical protein